MILNPLSYIFERSAYTWTQTKVMKKKSFHLLNHSIPTFFFLTEGTILVIVDTTEVPTSLLQVTIVYPV